MAIFIKFNAFNYDLLKGVHDFENDTFNIALTATAPTPATNGVLADITQIADGGGYTAGGYALSNVNIAADPNNAAVAIVHADDYVISAAGAALAAFRYVVVYNATATNGPIVNYYDYGSDLTLNDGEQLTLDFEAVAGFLKQT